MGERDDFVVRNVGVMKVFFPKMLKFNIFSYIFKGWGQPRMAAASYDQLLKQVEALKMENSNLRQELEDNSNHLTKLETEASTMKVSQALCLCGVSVTALCVMIWESLRVLCDFRFRWKSFSRLCNGKTIRATFHYYCFLISKPFFRNSFQCAVISTTLLAQLCFPGGSPEC